MTNLFMADSTPKLRPCARAIALLSLVESVGCRGRVAASPASILYDRATATPRYCHSAAGRLPQRTFQGRLRPRN